MGVIPYCPTSWQFHTIIRTYNRIGPNNLYVISILVGCLLGDAYVVKVKTNKTNIPSTHLGLNKAVDIKTICF